jgi:putative addiction module component (TIGR02574 family)
MTTIDIAAMPVEEKLKLMEALWDSLDARADRNVVSPAWYGEVLEERLRRLASGEETTAPWREAKARIRNQIRVGSNNCCLASVTL